MNQSSRTNRLMGLALMVGGILVHAAAVLTPGRVSIRPEDFGNLRVFLGLMADGGIMAHVSGMLSIVGAISLAIGLSSLLRLPRKPGLAGLALPIGVVMHLFGWGIYVIEMGMRHMAVHIVTHGVYPTMDQAARDDMGLAVFTAMGGIHVGFTSLHAFGTVLVGMALAARFRGFGLYALVAWALAIKGVAEVLDFAVMQHVHELEAYGTLLVISNMLVYLGATLMAVLGIGVFRGRPELVPEGS